MKKTIHIDEELLRSAKSATSAKTDTETVRLGLEALVRRAAYERLRALRGSEPKAQETPYAAALEELLSRDEVSGHELVYAELLSGDRGGREALTMRGWTGRRSWPTPKWPPSYATAS